MAHDIVTGEAVAGPDADWQRPQGPFCRLEEGRYYADTPLTTGFPLPMGYAEQRLWSHWPQPHGPTALLRRRRRPAPPTPGAPAVPAAPATPVAPAAGTAAAPPPAPQRQAGWHAQPTAPHQTQREQQPTAPGRSRGTSAAAPLRAPPPPAPAPSSPWPEQLAAAAEAAATALPAPAGPCTPWPRRLPQQPEGAGYRAAQVVFRAAPYAAELARQRQRRPAPRLLFLDEGQTCRAVLAEAVMRLLLSKLAMPLEHDLIVVMDAFDYSEVVRDVAVLDNINPSGLYFTRVRQLCSFAPAAAALRRAPPPEVQQQLRQQQRQRPASSRPAGASTAPVGAPPLAPAEIADPLYATASSAQEAAALRATVHQLTAACRGLLAYLLLLRRRCLRSSASTGVAAAAGASAGSCGAAALRQALAQSLQCPLLAPEVLQARHRLATAVGAAPPAGASRAGKPWRPVWLSSADGELYTIRSGGAGAPGGAVGALGAQRPAARVVRQERAAPKPRGYWRDGDSVMEELRRVRLGNVAGAWRGEASSHAGLVGIALPGCLAGLRPLALPHAAPSLPRRPVLRLWMESHGVAGRLPTQRELRASGANTLSAAVDALGGLAAFGEAMHLGLASGRRPNGYWQDFANLQSELEPFLDLNYAAQQAAAQAASSSEEQAEGEAEAEGEGQPGEAVAEHAATDGVAAEPAAAAAAAANPAGGPSPTRPEGAAPAAAAAVPAPAPARPRAFPTQHQLLAAGRADLVKAIRLHGGSKRVARLLSLSAARGALLGPQPQQEEVGAAVLALAEAQGWRGHMPGREELEALGRGDLWAAVQRVGGARRLAEALGLEWQERRGRKPRTAAAGARGAAAAGAAGEGAPSLSELERQERQAWQEFVFV
eukprot:scaffold1.g5558.t1